MLGQQGFSIAVKLIAHVQNGKTLSLSLINQGEAQRKGLEKVCLNLSVETHST